MEGWVAGRFYQFLEYLSILELNSNFVMMVPLSLPSAFIMSSTLSGATRLHFIVGDPIAQVKSPSGMTDAFAHHGHNAVCVPAHVHPDHLADWLTGLSWAQNVDGIIATVPHKFACAELCVTLSDRAKFLGAVNTMRRNADGSWHGDMFDGQAFVTAMRRQACEPRGKRALLAGAGGAGSAIAHALVTAGVSELAVHDPDSARRNKLINRLATLSACKVMAGSSDPSGFDLVLNATPMGMGPTDPLPFRTELLCAAMFCGCVVTAPPITPFIAVARARGCNTITGSDMFASVRDLMVDFLLAH
jgi:shikimate dehydrogenase